MSDKLTYLYIVGRGHSGSTLLELLLNRSQQIASMGELDLLSLQIYRDESTRWVGKCSCGERPFDCPVWGRVIHDIENDHGVDIVNKPFSWRLSDVGLGEECDNPGLIENVRHKYHRAVRTYCYKKMKKVPAILDYPYRVWMRRRDITASLYAKYSRVNVVVDASKDHLHLRDLNNYSKHDCKFIFLTRDVRGNVWSAIKRENVAAQQEAEDWVRVNSKILSMLSYVDAGSYMHVRYEDLCSDPDRVLSAIHEFIGLEYKEIDPDAEIQNRHTIAGNKIRFKKVESVKQDLGWQNNLTDDQLSVVRDIAGEFASKLGYSL